MAIIPQILPKHLRITQPEVSRPRRALGAVRFGPAALCETEIVVSGK